MILHRRTLCLVPLALTLAGAGAAEAAPKVVPAAAQSFSIGNWKAAALRDADNVLPNDGKVFGVGVGPQAITDVLKAAGAPTDAITLGVDALLVKSPDRTMLFDTGLGPGVHGALLASLATAGVEPSQVTDIFITHSHGDHVGGLVSADKTLAFPNATVRISAAEWKWMQAGNTAAIAKIIAPKVVTFEPGGTVVPGITSVALPGHTPGHTGYRIQSGDAVLMDIGDTAHSSIISLTKPEWAIGYDNDEPEGETTRKATLAELAKDGTRIFAPHFPFPGIGRIAASGDHFVFQPEKF